MECIVFCVYIPTLERQSKRFVGACQTAVKRTVKRCPPDPCCVYGTLIGLSPQLDMYANPTCACSRESHVPPPRTRELSAPTEPLSDESTSRRFLRRVRARPPQAEDEDGGWQVGLVEVSCVACMPLFCKLCPPRGQILSLILF